eukprot:716101-Rhodomonas_salina.1
MLCRLLQLAAASLQPAQPHQRAHLFRVAYQRLREKALCFFSLEPQPLRLLVLGQEKVSEIAENRCFFQRIVYPALLARETLSVPLRQRPRRARERRRGERESGGGGGVGERGGSVVSEGEAPEGEEGGAEV